MHQQLSLFSTISNADLKINLHSLAAITGMEPLKVFNHNIICKPRNPFRPQLKAGEVNLIEQYRITLTTELVEDSFKTVPHEYKTSLDKLKSLKWTLNVSEVPEAAKSKVINQGQLSSTVTGGDPFVFIDKLGYVFDSEYWLQGYQFVLGEIVVLIFRILVASDKNNSTSSNDASNNASSNTGDVTTSSDPVSVDQMEGNNNNSDNNDEGTLEEPMILDDDVLNADANASNAADTEKQPSRVFKLLDSSEKWVVKAYVNVSNLTDVDGLAEGRKALEQFQQDMSGLFELNLPERRSFDTRVKNT